MFHRTQHHELDSPPSTGLLRRLASFCVAGTTTSSTAHGGVEGDRVSGTSADGEEFILLGRGAGRDEIAERIRTSGWSTFWQARTAAGFTPDIIAIRASLGDSPDQ